MNKKLLCTLFCLSIIIVIGQVCFAAIEIVPSKDGTGKDQIVNISVSNAYLACQEMKNYGGSLYGTTVRPHLATNRDWGAVSYLANSIYGTNTLGKNTGITVTINGVKYYSTTTNITGVMNWGGNPNNSRYTFTAGLISNALSTDNNITELYNNINTEFVDISSEKQLGMAIGETSTFTFLGYLPVRTGSSTSYSVSSRSGFFKIDWGHQGNTGTGTGGASTFVTFRPVIWN